MLTTESKQYQSGLLQIDENQQINSYDIVPTKPALTESDKEDAQNRETDDVQNNNDILIETPVETDTNSPPQGDGIEGITNSSDPTQQQELDDFNIFEIRSLCRFKLLSWLNTLDQRDKHYTSYIQQLEFGCLFEMFMLIPTFFYSFIGISILIIIHSVIFKSILYFINSFLCLIINQTIKKYVQRRRPRLETIAERMVNLDGVLLVKHSSSMPSGDTAQATVFAVTMIYTMCYYFNVGDITWWWFLITIPVCGFERIYFGKHWIGDTLCGALEGILICVIVCGCIGQYLFF